MRGNKDTQSPALCGVRAPGTPLHPICAERGDSFPVPPAGSRPAPGTHPWALPKSSSPKAAPQMHLPPPASCCLSDLSRCGPALQASNSACLFSQHMHYRQCQEAHFKGEKPASTSPSPEFSGGWTASLRSRRSLGLQAPGSAASQPRASGLGHAHDRPVTLHQLLEKRSDDTQLERF